MIEPRHEQLAVWALLAWLVLGIIGVAVVGSGIGLALFWIAQWVFQ